MIRLYSQDNQKSVWGWAGVAPARVRGDITAPYQSATFNIPNPIICWISKWFDYNKNRVEPPGSK